MALAALAVALAAGCASGSDDGAGPVAPCPPTCPGSAAPEPADTAPAPPEGSAAWDALVVEPQPGELGRGGNDRDPALTTLHLTVAVPAGQRLRSRTVCQGQTSVTVTTRPPSGAESELACRDGEPDEVVVQDPAAVAAPTTYDVQVSAPAPARWYAVISAVP